LLPQAFQARYQLTRDELPIGHTQLSLQFNADGGYLYRSHTQPNALIGWFRDDTLLEESRGRIVQQRFKPQSYLYQRSGAEVERQVRMQFDWERRRVSMRGSSSRWSTRIAPDTLDKLVQQLVLSQDLRDGRQQRQYTVADGGRLKQYRYQAQGEEAIDTPLGTFDTLRIQRRKDDQPTDYTLWLAPALDYLPLRIVRRHQDVSYRMDLLELQRPTTLNPSPKSE
jgi:hypothetical protein